MWTSIAAFLSAFMGWFRNKQLIDAGKKEQRLDDLETQTASLYRAKEIRANIHNDPDSLLHHPDER